MLSLAAEVTALIDASGALWGQTGGQQGFIPGSGASKDADSVAEKPKCEWKCGKAAAQSSRPTALNAAQRPLMWSRWDRGGEGGCGPVGGPGGYICTLFRR